MKGSRILRAVVVLMAGLCCSAVHSKGGADLQGATVLVTGGAGFIGTHLLMNLAKQNCLSIVAVDNFNADYNIALKRLRAENIANATGIKVIKGDICSAGSDFMKHLLAATTFTHVVHLATQGGGGGGGDQGTQGVACVARVLQGLRQSDRYTGLSLPRLLYALPAIEANGENSADSFKAVDAFKAAKFGMTGAVGFLLPSVYGPMDRPDSTVARLTSAVLTGKHIVLPPYQLGRYAYVGDAAEAIAAALGARTLTLTPGGTGAVVFAMGCDTAPVPAASIVSFLEKYLGKKANVKSIDLSPLLSLPAEDMIPAERLPFIATVSMEQGLALYADWYKTRETSLIPCVSEMSVKGLCFNCGWTAAAKASRQLTASCDAVLYTVSGHAKTAALPAAPGNADCNVAFVNDQSPLFQTAERSPVTDSGSKALGQYHNWTLVGIANDLGSNVQDSRKLSRLPKINPRKFFAPRVRHAVYADTSVSLLVPVKDVVGRMTTRAAEGPGRGRSGAVFAAVRRAGGAIESLYDDIASVQETLVAKKRFPGIQAKLSEYKDACESYQQKYKGLLYNNVFDGSLFVHDLHSPMAREFRRRWFREYQEWADREQIAASFVIGMMHYQHMGKENLKTTNLKWVAIGSDEKRAAASESAFVRLLPAEEGKDFFSKNI
jgi:UDP-glucuronate 4-epimerase